MPSRPYPVLRPSEQRWRTRPRAVVPYLFVATAYLVVATLGITAGAVGQGYGYWWTVRGTAPGETDVLVPSLLGLWALASLAGSAVAGVVIHVRASPEREQRYVVGGVVLAPSIAGLLCVFLLDPVAAARLLLLVAALGYLASLLTIPWWGGRGEERGKNGGKGGGKSGGEVGHGPLEVDAGGGRRRLTQEVDTGG